MMFRTVFKNWPVLVGLAATFGLWRINAIPAMFRAFIEVPMFMFAILASYLLLRSVFCRSTTDALGDNATAVHDAWADLTPGQRMQLMVFERVGFLIAGAIIVAGLLIIYGGPSGAAAAIEAAQ
jgi:hypothetical protein